VVETFHLPRPIASTSFGIIPAAVQKRFAVDNHCKIRHACGMNASTQYRHYTIIGWAMTLVGCVLWTYGYFVGGSQALLNWPAFAPSWIADYLPNLPAEIGVLLTLVGSIPIYYAQIQDFRQAK
jgi:hypothetical protein